MRDTTKLSANVALPNISRTNNYLGKGNNGKYIISFNNLNFVFIYFVFLFYFSGRYPFLRKY